MMRTFPIIVILILLVHQDPSAQENDHVAARFMFYNVENLFDVRNDSLKDDDEFLPDGERRWTLQRYRSKVNSLYKVIIYSGNPEPPAMIGLCEVENRSVLSDLINSSGLIRFNYSIIHEDSDDPRGIDVAMIYRPDKAKLLNYRYLYPEYLRNMNVSTRSILHSVFLINGDTLHIIVNHWPSRRGGVLAGESSREAISEFVKGLADSISASQYGGGRIIICGDFNAEPSDNEILRLVKNGGVRGKSMLVNLSDQREFYNRGTYKYRGIWEMIDQVIVSEYLLANRDGIYTDYPLLRIVDPEFLLERDDTYPGMKPFATYGGYIYRGGFSDHLPVILDLKSK